MKITLLCYGSRGDVQPYAALALALKSRGHSPKLSAPENFRSYAEGLGIEFDPLWGDTRAMMDDEEAQGYILAGKNVAFFNKMRRVMREHQSEFIDSILRVARGSEVLVSSPLTEFLTLSAAEAVGARCVLSYLMPQLPSGEFANFGLPLRSLGLPFLNRISHDLFEAIWWRVGNTGVVDARQRWKLPPLHSHPGRVFRSRGGLSLLGYSPEIFPKPADWDDSYAVTGAWQIPSGVSAGGGDEEDAGFTQWLEDGSPPIYIGFGSMPVPDHLGFLEMAAEVCEELGMRVLIGAGWNDIPMQACDLPDNLAIVEQANHSWLFPQCAAIVHHGGAGTTHAGLAAGVPNLVCPFFADQPFWARQVERLGAGKRLDFIQMSPQRLKRALLQVLDEQVAVRAAELGAKISAERGAERACEAIEAHCKEA